MDNKELNKPLNEEESNRKKVMEGGPAPVRPNITLGNVQDAQFINSSTEENSEKSETEDYKSLGKSTILGKRGDEEEIKRINEKLGYTELIISNLPSHGKFYPYGMKIMIRPATVQEIRDYSTMEETNLYDVDDKLNNILLSCTKVELDQNRKGSYKDILEEDRIYVLLNIKEITFKHGENRLSLPANCGQCDNQNNYELKTVNLQFFEVSDDIERYYSDIERCYVIPTKSSGTLKMSPPRIGVMKEITSLIQKKQEKNEKWDKAFLQLLPYIIFDWRGFSEKQIFDKHIEFQGWSREKFAVIYRLAEKMRIGVKQEMIYPCEKCGQEVTVPITFRGGLKSIFIPDIEDELL